MHNVWMQSKSDMVNFEQTLASKWLGLGLSASVSKTRFKSSLTVHSSWVKLKPGLSDSNFQDIQRSPDVNARKITFYFYDEMFNSAQSMTLSLEITNDSALLIQKSLLFTLRRLSFLRHFLLSYIPNNQLGGRSGNLKMDRS